MSDEQLELEVPEEVVIPEITQETEGREYTDFEREQMEDGWNPKGKKTAEEWADNKDLAVKVRKQSKKLKTLNRTIDSLKSFMQKQEETAYNRALEDINRQRQQAVAEGDRHEVERLDRQAQDIRPVPTEVIAFKEKHADWLNNPRPKEMKMARFAQQVDSELMKYSLPPAEHMKLLEEHVMAEFPAYFKVDEADDEEDEKPVKQKASAVSSGTGGNVAGSISSKKRYTYNDLSDVHKKVANDFKVSGVMSIQEYIDALVKRGDLKK